VLGARISGYNIVVKRNVFEEDFAVYVWNKAVPLSVLSIEFASCNEPFSDVGYLGQQV
jgi:hypothetical protein